MVDKKLVLFGAGKIGRSFIGQVFSRSGYEVIFVDIDHQLIANLNKHKQYRVIIKSPAGDETILVTNVRGVHLSETEKVTAELANASIAALSVGKKGLTSTLPVIAESLVIRQKKYGQWPLDILIAENIRNADRYILKVIKSLLQKGYDADSMLGLVETSIGKMVPIMSQKELNKDPLWVFAESYNSLIVDKKGFKNPVPEVSFLSPKENIKAWVDRKLFIHNLGHATAAYLGFQKNPDMDFIYEVLSDDEIYKKTRQTMLQSADILICLYPGEFTRLQIENHIDDLLERFKNKALGDSVYRVGCDLFRKLSPEDRLVMPINAAIKLNKPFNLIFKALVAGISFRATDENGKYFPADEKFFKEAEKGVEYILENICKLQRKHISDGNYRHVRS